MKSFLLLILSACFIFCVDTRADAAGTVTISSVAVPVANIAQGTNTNVIYIAKLDVTVQNVNITNVVANLTGTYDNTDLSVVQFYYNASAPTISGASFGGSVAGNFAGPHSFTLPTSFNVNAGTSVYILITVNTNTNATDNHTVTINGATDPITIQATVAPTVVDNQTNAAGVQTIQASDVAISSISLPAANIAQGTNTNVIYIAKLDVTTENINITSITANLTGTYANTDFSVVQFYYNASAPTIGGASFGGSVAGNFAGPHSFTLPTGFTVTAGTSVYILFTVNTNTNATDNHTVTINGATDPITIQSTTTPNITNNQTNAAGVQTIQASDVAISSISLPAANIAQGTNTNVIYIAKLDVTTENINITSVTANLTGTYDNTDLSVVQFYYNASTPTISGASFGGSVAGNFAGPHSFTLPTGFTVTAGTSVYILFTVNTNTNATDNHTVTINGATDPITIQATTTPNITNNQTNAAGVQTIQASDVAISSIALPAANIAQGTNTNVIYIAKLDVTTENINITSITANLTGTYANTDFSVVQFYYNASAPTISGASFGGSVAGNFAGPHSFTLPTSFTVTAGTSVYILFTVNTTIAATDGNTVHIDGATDPITIQATTTPNITNSQTNAAGVQTIQAADVAISSVSVPSNNIMPGSNTNIIYIAKLDVGGQSLQITSVTANLTGTYDNTDLSVVQFYYNASAPTISGASFGGSVAGNFAGPHTFTIPSSFSVSPGTTVYIIITVNVTSGANINNTVNINGVTNPISFLATTTPVVANNQTNAAGVFTISNVSLPLKLTSFTAKKIPGHNQVALNWTTVSEINTKNFDVQWSTDGLSYASEGSVAAQGNSQTDTRYAFVHAAPANGINYYRLKMIDIDGQFTFSPVATIQLEGVQRSMIIAPNPVTTQLRLVVNYTEQIKMLRVYDANGRTIWQASNMPNTGIITVPFDKYAKGLYNAEVTTQSGIERLQFIKAGR